ncbi:DUF1836 domain-containing protein [Bacillota bacterium]
MEKLIELKKRLETERPVEWEDFPDINLYKDQVVVYLKRQLINLEKDGQLTPAMISNYVKDKLLPKADGKTYNKEHLALLTEICLLKQVLMVKDIDLLLKEENSCRDAEDFYTRFIDNLDKSISIAAEKVETDWNRKEAIEMAFKFAIESYTAKLICESLIGIIREQDEPVNNKKNKGKSC